MNECLPKNGTCIMKSKKQKQKMLILHNVQFLVKKNRLRESTVRSKGYMEDLQQKCADRL